MPIELFGALDRVIAGNTLRTWLVVVLVLALGWLLGRFARFVLTRLVPKLTAHTKSELDDKLVARAVGPVAQLVMVGAAHVSVQILDLPDRTHDAAVSTLVVLLALVLAVLLMRVIDTLFEELAIPWAGRQTPPVHAQAINLARGTIKVLAGVFVGVTVLQRAGFNVLSVITGLGIGGIAVALAAQETLGNILGSLQIMTDRPFSPGDWVRVNGLSGEVISVGMRSTKLLSSTNVKLVIPNKKIAEASIENFSHVNGIAGEATIGLLYSTPPEQVAAVAADLARELPKIVGVHPDVSVQFRTFGDSSINLRVTFFVQPGHAFGGVLHALNLAILERVHVLGANFAFPTRTVHIADRAAPVPALPQA